jgi:hypothetical protein
MWFVLLCNSGIVVLFYRIELLFSEIVLVLGLGLPFQTTTLPF